MKNVENEMNNNKKNWEKNYKSKIKIRGRKQVMIL